MLYMFCSLENLQEYLSLIPLVTIIQIHTLKQWFWIVHYQNSCIYWWNFCQYLYYHFISNEFTNWITDGNASSIKLSSVIFCLSVSPSIIIKKYLLLMDLLARKTCQNVFYLLHFVDIFLGKLVITDINNICNFVGDYLKILF
jgi:hypothetical protein